jgi:ABC-2 type transport system permease protein
MQRYLSMTLMLIGMPIVFLLLFVYVFGGTLGAGLGGPSGGRAEYLEFVVPGILLIAVAAGGTGTAISVATDMTEGIVAASAPWRSTVPRCWPATSSAA